MKKLSKKLSEFIVSGKPEYDSALEYQERKIYRSLKSSGERSTKGREIDSCMFEAMNRGGATMLNMVLEGRHSMSICNQVARRFESINELEFAKVIKTKRGAKLVLKVKEEAIEEGAGSENRHRALSRAQTNRVLYEKVAREVVK